MQQWVVVMTQWARQQSTKLQVITTRRFLSTMLASRIWVVLRLRLGNRCKANKCEASYVVREGESLCHCSALMEAWQEAVPRHEAGVRGGVSVPVASRRCQSAPTTIKKKQNPIKKALVCPEHPENPPTSQVACSRSSRKRSRTRCFSRTARETSSKISCAVVLNRNHHVSEIFCGS